MQDLGVEPLKYAWYIISMPAKYVVRNFSEDSYYHVFNRGVEKRKIFMDDQDYNMFLYYMFIYLNPLEKVLGDYPKLPMRLQSKNLHREIELYAYCLMPNHFHLLIKQKNKDGISKFLKQMTNAYTQYFNEKYDRVGGLMQGRYKAVEVKTDELFLHIVRYIHLNPVVADLVKTPKDYKWSSHKDYLENKNDTLIKEDILNQFRSPKDFNRFVSDQIDYANNLKKIQNLAID